MMMLAHPGAVEVLLNAPVPCLPPELRVAVDHTPGLGQLHDVDVPPFLCLFFVIHSVIAGKSEFVIDSIDNECILSSLFCQHMCKYDIS